MNNVQQASLSNHDHLFKVYLYGKEVLMPVLPRFYDELFPRDLIHQFMSQANWREDDATLIGSDEMSFGSEHSSEDLANFLANLKTDSNRQTQIGSLVVPLLNANSKVSLVESQEMGTHCVANSVINANETLFSQQPYVHHYLSDFLETHCAHCFKRLTQYARSKDSDQKKVVLRRKRVRCSNCSVYIFCDDNCKQACLDEFHQSECITNRFMFAMEEQLGIAYLVVRLVHKQGGLKNSLSHFGQHVTMDMKPSADWTNVGSDQYALIARLKTHMDDYDSDVQASYVLMALAIVALFQRYQMIDSSINEFDVFRFCLYHLFQLSTNVITIYNDVEPEYVDPLSDNSKPLAIGLFASISYLNHSCQQQLEPTFQGKNLKLNSTGKIEAGEQIYANYGYIWNRINLPLRRTLLKKQYFFDCCCYRCVRGDTCMDGSFACSNCNGPAFYLGPDSNGNPTSDFTVSPEVDSSSRIVCCRCSHSVPVGLAERQVLEEVTRQQGYDSLAHNQYLQYKQSEDRSDDDIVQALVAFSNIDQVYSQYLYCLNPVLVELKSKLIDCYQLAGHYCTAQVYSTQLLNMFTKYSRDDAPNDPEVYYLQLANELIRMVKLIAMEATSGENGASPKKLRGSFNAHLSRLKDLYTNLPPGPRRDFVKEIIQSEDKNINKLFQVFKS